MSEGIGLGSIGSFSIGVSSIGSTPWDFSVTALAQYANSPTLQALMADFSAWIDPTLDFDNFYDYVWNVDTAQGFGLDIWGRIVGVGRIYPVSTAIYLEFEEAGDGAALNEGIFYTGSSATVNVALSDDAYRRLILAKAMANITDGSIPAINQLLRNMFPGRGNAYVIDSADMTMIYKFEFALTPVDLTIVANSGVLPQPAGITISTVHT
jgi:hypothetical protein